MVITRLDKWFGIELYCVSTDRVSDLAVIEWFRRQRLTTGYFVTLEVDQPRNKRFHNKGISRHLPVELGSVYIGYEGS